MTRVAIPEMKDALRRLTRQGCADAVREAIEGATDASEARRVIEGRLDTALRA